MKVRTDFPIFEDRGEISRKIANFWDKISLGWRTIWGPHIHHGYYENDNYLTPLQAQIKLIEKLAALIKIIPNAHILDVGCGMGGSTLYLAKHHSASVTGITLSPKQIVIATQQAIEEKIPNVSFKLEDALSLASFSDNSFDIVWSLESCEQFYDKKLFIQQAFRVLKPGGKLILATWCSAQEEFEGPLAKKYLKLCRAFDLPYMPTSQHYQKLIASENFNLDKVLDWTEQVKNSWQIGLTLASAYSFLQLLKMGGLRGLQFVKQAKLMQHAFQENRVKYGVFLATKAQ